MFMFNSPEQVNEFSKNLHKSTDNMIAALNGCDFKTAIAIIDWMKELVISNACVVAQADNSFSSAHCPTFPFNNVVNKN